MCSSQNFPKIFQFVKGLSLVEQKVVEKLLFFQIKHVGPWRKKAKKVKEFLNFYLFFFFEGTIYVVIAKNLPKGFQICNDLL